MADFDAALRTLIVLAPPTVRVDSATSGAAVAAAGADLGNVDTVVVVVVLVVVVVVVLVVGGATVVVVVGSGVTSG